MLFQFGNAMFRSNTVFGTAAGRNGQIAAFSVTRWSVETEGQGRGYVLASLRRLELVACHPFCDETHGHSVDLISGDTETWRQLTQTLTETLHELQSGRSEVYNPRHLFSRLSGRMPQFGGGDQHDAHELLRHLLEAVREEDQRRFKAVILEKLGG